MVDAEVAALSTTVANLKRGGVGGGGGRGGPRLIMTHANVTLVRDLNNEHTDNYGGVSCTFGSRTGTLSFGHDDIGKSHQIEYRQHAMVERFLQRLCTDVEHSVEVGLLLSL